jgi:hypothetical protein
VTGLRPSRLSLRVLRIADRLQRWCIDHSQDPTEGERAFCRVYSLIIDELRDAVREEQRSLTGDQRAN